MNLERCNLGLDAFSRSFANDVQKRFLAKRFGSGNPHADITCMRERMRGACRFPKLPFAAKHVDDTISDSEASLLRLRCPKCPRTPVSAANVGVGLGLGLWLNSGSGLGLGFGSGQGQGQG